MGAIPSIPLPDGAEVALARRVGGVGNNCRLAPKSPWSRGSTTTTPVGGVEGSGSGTVREAFSCCFFCFFLLLLVLLLLLETLSCFLFLFLEEEGQALAAADEDDDKDDELAP